LIDFVADSELRDVQRVCGNDSRGKVLAIISEKIVHPGG
jgi:hypothetical protein